MERNVPVWLLLLVVLVGLLFTALFGWAVRSTMGGSDRSGLFGEAAVAVASFPGLVRETVTELSGEATGRADRALAVLNPGPVPARGLAPVEGLGADRLTGLTFATEGEGPKRGYRVLSGIFAVDDGSGAGDRFVHRALMLSPEMEIVRRWDLEAGLETSGTRRDRAITHGFALTEALEPIYNLDGGNALRKLGACGGLIWERVGPYHHAVSLGPRAGREVVWTLRHVGEGAEGEDSIHDTIVAVDPATGEEIAAATTADIIAANPDSGILEIRRAINDAGTNWNRRPPREVWLSDPFHLNDVEALPAGRAAAFPGFEAGDLMLSARSLDLVFVIDPETLALRWYSHGPWIRQHDPDWQPDGRITVFDNRMGREWSEIRAMEPRSRASGVLVDGAGTGFYTRIRGVHQVLPGGNVLVSSPQQGRVFEVTPDGRVVLEILNRSTDGTRAYNITSATWLPEDAVPGDGTCPD